MDRETRKANLRKLQLPGTSAKIQQQRKTRQSDKGTSSISNYFHTPEKTSKCPQDKQETFNSPHINNGSIPNQKTTRAKRTKLDAFLFKEPQTIPKDLKNEPRCANDDDFDVPVKKAKKAPQKSNVDKTQTKTVKPSRRKKQNTIKSAFLRNEQLFAEIAGQHCAADNFDGDDVQLAIAISKSEAEINGIANNDENIVNDVGDLKGGEKHAEIIRQQLEKYGFRTAEKKDYNTFAAAFMPKSNGRRKKSKWANKFTALTLRDEQVQNKKLQQRIEDLLNQQLRTESFTAEENQHSNYLLQSGLLRKGDQQNKERVLQPPEDEQIPHKQYFVEELFEISKLSPGHLLKDWAAIQGRDLTPKKRRADKEAMTLKMRQIYADLEEYFQNRINSSPVKAESNFTAIETDDKTNEELHPTTSREQPSTEEKAWKSAEPIKTDDLSNNNLVKNYFMPFSDKESDATLSSDTSSTNSLGNKILHLIPPTKSLDLMQVSDSSIRTEAATFNLTQLSGSNTSEDSETKMLSDVPVTKMAFIIQPCADLDVLQASSRSITTEATINSTQKTRSNSPDLFADSDIEMEDNDNAAEDAEVVNDVSTIKGSRSIDNVARVNTYEIYSSDEVKKPIFSDVPDQYPPLKERLSSSQSMAIESIIDLTQDDGEEETALVAALDRSKAIVELDLFADSPLNDEEPELVADINSNSKKSKYSPNIAEETFKLTLSLEANDDANSVVNNGKEDTFKFTLSMDNEPVEECETDKDVAFNNITTTHQRNSYLSNFQGPDENDTNKSGENSFQLSLSLDVERRHECEDGDDAVLREMANTSFYNFQGPKQLETYFHRETAAEPKVSPKPKFAGNDTIFRELYNKYLGGGAATQNPSSYIESESSNTTRKSFSQTVPKIITPKRNDDEYQFVMDMETTMEYNIANRKSLSFNIKTPDKTTTFSNITTLSKSQSFTERNVSIDLTQNGDDEEDEDDDCLVLSDDEINYSIWKANKTENYRDSKENSDCDDAISVDDFGLNEKATNVENDHQSFDKQSSLLDIPNEELSPPKNILSSQCSYSDFELQSPKTNDWEHKLERSNFGIMEEFSEPIDFTPHLSTPTKVLSEASFLQSPSELSAPMKRYSHGNNSTQKLNDLLKSIDDEIAQYNNIAKYDAFDYLINQNQLKKTTPAAGLPQDFEQLMTAEISFKESQNKSYGSNSLSSTDIDNLEKVKAASTIPLMSKRKTPAKSRTDQEELTINNKTYTIRSTECDKPNFAQYSEAQLLKELYSYGIKPLKRKQAVKMLEYIYIQTHPIIVDEPTEQIPVIEDINVPSTSKSSKTSKITLKSFQNEPSQTVPSIATTTEDVSSSVSNRLDLRDGCGTDMLRYSLDLKAELFDEQYILQTNVTKKTPQPLMPFHIAWYNLVCSNQKLHENILMYEPIDLQDIYLFLKGLGYRYDPKDLKQFFDHRCIIFRYDLAAAGGNSNKVKESNRHVRKKKKTNR